MPRMTPLSSWPLILRLALVHFAVGCFSFSFSPGHRIHSLAPRAPHATTGPLSSLADSYRTQLTDEVVDTRNAIANGSSPSLSSPFPSTAPSPPVVVVLNTNARGVSGDLVAVAERVIGPDAVFPTATVAQARAAAAALLRRNASLVVPVGGDGTLSSLVQGMVECLRAGDANLTTEQAMRRLPVIGYIAMGTGNGVGSVVGCRPPPTEARRTSLWRRLFRRKQVRQERLAEVLTLLKLVGKELQRGLEYDSIIDNVDRVDLPMMELTIMNNNTQSKGSDLCFFAGVGFDSLMLQDFKDIKAWSQRRRVLPQFLGSVAGYCVALVFRTLPKCVRYSAHKIQVTIVSHDPETLWIDHRRGDVVQSMRDPLVYNGTAGIVAAGTSPFYGGGLRLFPFARLSPSKMHLRLGRIHPLLGFVNIPRIFSGSYRDLSDESFGCLDFLGDDFEVTVREQRQDSSDGPRPGYPLQHSGESVGVCESFRLKVVKTPLRFVTFLKRRVVQDYVI